MKQLKEKTEKGPMKEDLATPSQPCIEMQGVRVVFDSKLVLNGFSLTVCYEEKVVLTGPSGRGKSTVLRCILGFVKPDSGTIKLCGKPVCADTVWDLRQLVAYVPQEPDLGRKGTVRQWLDRPFEYKANRDKKENLRQVPDLFHRFLLPLELLDKEVTVLSGGEKQRVAIVSALLLQRPILLLDEPTSALDDLSKKRLAEFLGSRGDLTILVVSHDSAMLSVANRSIDMGKGE